MNLIKLIIVWTWVALPLGWGVLKSVQKSAPLFSATKSAPVTVGPK